MTHHWTRGKHALSRAAWFILAAAVVIVPAASGAQAASASGAQAATAKTPLPPNVKAACTWPPKSGHAACLALVRTDIASQTGVLAASPAGNGPADLRSAYKLQGASAQDGSGETVAIVDAYDDPNAESDLAVYRAQYGLPPCTTANGCFKKVNQSGKSGNYPPGDPGWAIEISLDVDMVSAICPHCNILLVEASSASFTNLGTAVNYAASVPGVVAISNSYGGSDSSSDSSYDSHYYDHPGIAVTASSGDGGYGVEYPASSQYVTAVGGTSLSPAANGRGWTEAVWNGAGSGCSANEPGLSWQQALSGLSASCSTRVVADVSADADPNTGVAVYDSYAYQGYSGWLIFGGTSVASPIIASVYALAANTATIANGSYPYAHDGSLNPVTAGANGSCAGSYLCTAGTTTGDQYSGPAGLGSPNGTGAF